MGAACCKGPAAGAVLEDEGGADEPVAEEPPVVKKITGPTTIRLRPKANPHYALCVTRDGIKNGGWVHMWKISSKEKDVYAEWELSPEGVLRTKADWNYVLCVRHDGVVNGGNLHIWQQGDQVNMYGQWTIDRENGLLRSKIDRNYCLCIRQNALKNGGGLHMWSFDDREPDKYAQWEIQDDIEVDNSELVITDAEAGNGETETLLEPVVRHFKASVHKSEINRLDFVEGLIAFAGVLNKMGGGMGDHLLANVEKLKRAKADANQLGYRAWLLSEAPVHAATGYKSYVDDSAWMANVWIAWTLQFFVEMFAWLEQGKDVKAAFEQAYKNTLHKHHNMFQRTAFKSASSKLPVREQLWKLLGAGAKEEKVTADVQAFVDQGRMITDYCLQVNAELENKMEEERIGKRF